MNIVSFSFILAFGVLFGYVFPYLLEELGVSKKFSRSLLATVFLVFLSFIGFLLYAFVLFGQFAAADLGTFYDRFDQNWRVFLWLAVMLFVGGGAHMLQSKLREMR
jgi:hypothetical protein